MRVLITGGSRGIGKAIAQELSKKGHDLLLVSRNKERLQHGVKEVSVSATGRVEQFVCDVANQADLAALYQYCQTIGLMPEVLILNAGIFIEGTLSSSDPKDFDETLKVNFLSIYHIVQLFINDLKRRSGAKIILIGSTAAYEPYPLGPLYGVAKWALRGYAINLRKELMHDNIAVTFLSPGGTWTDLWAGEDLPEDRLLEASDIGKVVATILELSNQAVVEDIVIRPMLGDIHE